jgi:hypothetical protein
VETGVESSEVWPSGDDETSTHYKPNQVSAALKSAVLRVIISSNLNTTSVFISFRLHCCTSTSFYRCTGRSLWRSSMMESIAPHGLFHRIRRCGLRQATVIYEGFHTHCHATLPAQDAIPPLRRSSRPCLCLMYNDAALRGQRGDEGRHPLRMPVKSAMKSTKVIGHLRASMDLGQAD